MDERVKLGFTFAKEIVTQLITLSIAFLTLTITFTKELLPAGSDTHRAWLKSAWVLHVIAICCGVWSLLALTGTLMPGTPDDKPLATLTLENNVRVPAMLQIFAFAFGTILIVVFAFRSLGRRR